MNTCIIALLLLSINQLIRVAAYNLTMSPDHLRVSWRPETVTFTCTASVALTGCQFRLWVFKFNGKPGPVLDLSRGSLSQTNSSLLDDELTGYRYSGRGLGSGDCGVSLQVTGVLVRMVACRVRTETGGWTYAWSDLDGDGYVPFPHTLTPREYVVVPGGEARIALKAQLPLDWCYFWRPNFTVVFNEGARSKDSTDRHRYLGAGVEEGECGLALSNVTEEDNGLLQSYIRNEDGGKVENRLMIIIVAQRPTDPLLTVEQERNSINATCVVANSRPLPQITWILGDDVVRQNTLDDSPDNPQDEWRWPWSNGSLVQRVSLGLKPSDNGKNLKCRVSHVTLDEPLEAVKRISISTTCPPLTSSKTTIVCHSRGQEVDCTRPQPIGFCIDVTCKPGYVAVDDVTNRRVKCSETGEWDPPVFACRPDCGRRKTNEGRPHIHGGEVSMVGEFPWHVAVYEKFNDSYTQLCGGSLISTRIVISAAHCFWSNFHDRKKDSVYMVAAGKYKRAWLDPEDDEDNVQRRQVEAITIHPLYHGRQANFQSDIALVRLSTQVDITVNVNLVCVDWENQWQKSQLRHCIRGLIPGWGYTEQGQLSSVLKHVELPYIDHHTCYNAIDRTLKPLLTSDKFCAGYANLSVSTCRGDSGGGLVFLRESSNQYYLRGLLSVSFKPASNKDQCYAQSYTAFTLVSNFLRWIHNHVV